MKFELLPNEIFIECFEYLNAFDIFHSFDQLNDRFNNLIRHIPLYINFKDVKKSIFDEFCTKMIRNPQIKNQIYSLQVLDEDECVQGNIFLSIFSIHEFSKLRKFKSELPLITSPDILNQSWRSPSLKLDPADPMFSQLRSLSILFLRLDMNIDKTSSIINLTITHCDLDSFYCLIKYAPMLKYLYIKQTKTCYLDNFDIHSNDQSARDLKQLIIGEFTEEFIVFKKFIKKTPNLKILTISASDNDNMIDAGRWEQLITSLLPYLNVFKFKFSCGYYYVEGEGIIPVDKFKRFQTDFWQEQHHWFTEYVIENDSVSIYTIPYISNTYVLTPNIRRYCNNLINNVNTFVNVTDLILYAENLTENCQYYFSNVTSLRLIQTGDDSLTTNNIEYLNKVVNLKYLDISGMKNMKNASVTTVLSSDQSSGAKQLCEIFTNVEHLRCTIGHQGHLLFLLNHLSKLSTLYVRWITQDDDKKSISQFENEAQKRNLIYDIMTYIRQGDDPEDEECERQIFIWIGKDMT